MATSKTTRPSVPFGDDGQFVDSASGLVNDRARFYEPTTGTFTTRDPAFATTDTAYTYAGDDPVNGSDPSGLETVGLCGSVSLGGGVFKQVLSAVGLGLLTSTAASGSICEVDTINVPADEWALTVTAGFSYYKTLGAWAGVSGTVQLSTASHVNDLSGVFHLAQGSFGSVTGGVFWGGATSPSGPNAILGIDLGAGLSLGAGVTSLPTNTWVFEATNWVAKQVLEWAWRIDGGAAADAAAYLIGNAARAARDAFAPAGAATVGLKC